jgi:carbamoyl-phosphate synthase large subunit
MGQRVQWLWMGGVGAMPTSADNTERTVRVAVTGFGGLDDAGPGVSVAQALRDGWVGHLAVCAWSYGGPANGVWLPDVVDRLHVLPALDGGEQQLFEAIADASEMAPIDALIPGEGDVLIMARLADRLAERGIRTLLPPLHLLEAISRLNLPRFLHEREIPVPLTIDVAQVDHVAALAERIGFPLCVRGLHAGERLVYSARQAAKAAQQLEAGRGVILQYQPAGDRFSVALVAGGDGHPPVLVTMRTVAVNGDGRSVSGTIVNLPHIESLALRFVEASRWRGPLTLELVQPLHSQPFVCDAKPHLPTWCRASHWAGVNLAVTLLHAMLGLRQKRARPRAGTMFVRGVTECPVAMRDLLRVQQCGWLDRITATPRASPPRMVRGSKRVVVAITGTSTFDVINPGLGVARSLREVPRIKRIYGLSYGTLESGSYQPALFDEVFRLPDSGSAEALLQRLEEIHRSHPIDVLIPCLDGELPLFIQLQDKLQAIGIRTLLPDQKALDRRAKKTLFSGRLRSDWGAFSIPHSRFARSEAETMQAVQAIGLPAVVKGPLFMCFPVTSIAEARWAWHHLASAGWREVIVQRRISGAHYAISVVCDRQHRTRTRLTIKKLLTCQRGSTWGAVRVEQPRLEADFSRFLQLLAWTGPGEGEFIRDDLTDRFYLIEVNPRFTGWIYYSAALGWNQPAAAVSVALGERIGVPAHPRDVAFTRRTNELPLRPSQLAALATKGYLRHA